MKREKKVFTNAQEVVQKWTYQNQESGRYRCRNISFEGKTLYSYSTAIASFIKSDVVLISRQRYSNATSKHQNLARFLLKDGIRKYYVRNCTAEYDSTHNSNIEDFMCRIKDYSNLFWKARKYKERYFESCTGLVEILKDYCKEFSLTQPILLSEEVISINPKAEEIVFLQRTTRKLLGE